MTIGKTTLFVLSFATGALLCLFLFSQANPTEGEKELDETTDLPRKGSDSTSLSECPGTATNESSEVPSIPFQEDEWKPGTPHPVEPEDTALPPSGKAPLRTLLGWKQAWYVHNSVCGFVSAPSQVSYTRTSGKTSLTFSSGWTIDVDDETGQILVPPGLPILSDEDLVDMTWRSFIANEGLERWRTIYRRTGEDGMVLGELRDVRLDEIRRVGDKAVVAWRLVESPPPEEVGFIRIIYWVDVRTGKIVSEGEEINEDR